MTVDLKELTQDGDLKVKTMALMVLEHDTQNNRTFILLKE